MIREGHDRVTFFVGGEVETTPAFSKKTLFVVGEQKLADILKHAASNNVSHIFMGANHSFDERVDTVYWNTTITALLDKGFWVTLDYQAHEHNAVLKILNPGVWQSRLFVPLLSIRIPHFETSNANLTIKIDDIDFNSTNPGVWCMHYAQVADSNRFTGWTDYVADTVIETATYNPKVAALLDSMTNKVSVVDKLAEYRSLSKIKPAPANEQNIGLDNNTKSVPEEKDTHKSEESLEDIIKAVGDATKPNRKVLTRTHINDQS